MVNEICCLPVRQSISGFSKVELRCHLGFHRICNVKRITRAQYNHIFNPIPLVDRIILARLLGHAFNQFVEETQWGFCRLVYLRCFKHAPRDWVGLRRPELLSPRDEMAICRGVGFPMSLMLGVLSLVFMHWSSFI